jgi:hypothetical protein
MHHWQQTYVKILEAYLESSSIAVCQTTIEELSRYASNIFT